MYDPYAKFTKHVLPNGLEVHSTYWDRPWIIVEVIIHTGSREDPVVMPGLAHFVEHVVSQNIPDREFDSVKEFFETCGGKAKFGSTNYLSTRYKFSVPADVEIFREALIIFGSMLLQARIKRDVERERRVIFREFNERYPFSKKLEWDVDIRKSLFRGHRLETWNRPLGRPEGFLATTEADLQTFYDTHYLPANISLVIIGGLQANQVITELEKSPFGIVKCGTRNQIPKPFGPLPVPIERKKTVKLSDYVSFRVDQTEYRATWAFPADFPRQASRVFDSVLGQMLFSEIRKKRGLAYSIGTNYIDFQDVYEYRIGSLINPNATSYIDELVQRCIEMVPSRRNLFDQKLESLKQKCLMIDLAGQGLANKSADDLVSKHRIIPIKEVWDDIHKVTFEQMAEAAELLHPDRKYILMACP